MSEVRASSSSVAPVDPEPEPADAPAAATKAIESGEARGHTTVQRFWLVVVAGPDTGATLVSEGERVVIGTHESAQLVLTDDTVSRFHCEIAADGARVRVQDLGSRNGTRIASVQVLSAWLRDGAVLRLGHTEIRFELRVDPVQLPLSPADRFGTLLGKSPAMRRAFTFLERAAASDAAVLLEGETGTGKEAAAESIHTMSNRAEGPFIVVDCAAVPPDLLESELFGHERGSFTGAAMAREGAFEAASGGTVFLDEIGELGLELQPKLLRVLERKQIKRVGSNRYVPVDVRVVAATNRNLRREVNEKRFRADLYYRLAVVEVRLPSLEERTEDLPMLVVGLLDRLGASSHPDAAELTTPEFLASLASHRWPGNVRELRNYLERCLTLRTKTPLESGEGDGPLPDYDRPLRVARERWNRVLERRYAEELLRRSGGKVAAAARAAGVDRMYFYRLLWRHGIR